MSTELEDLVAQRLEDLRIAQEQLDPNISIHVIEIHKSLKEHPEIVSILSDEQIRTYITARRKMANITLSPVKASAAKKTAAKKAATLDLDDIG
jgi:hypothetical protein